MRRFIALFVGILGSLSVTTMATAQAPPQPPCPCPANPGTPFLVSGQPLLAILDDDGNGPDPGDCSFAAFLNTTNLTTLTIVPSDACGFECFMGEVAKGADSMSNFGMVELDDCSDPHAHSLPLMAKWVDHTGNPSTMAPLRLDSPDDLISLFLDGGDPGSGALFCNAGGTAARVTVGDGPPLLWPLNRVEKGGMHYLCVPNLPLAPSYMPVDACIPAMPDGGLTLALKSSPRDLLAEFNLNTLPGCAVAPAASTWGLIAMVLALLGVGTWALARRPGFYRSLGGL